MKLAEFKPGDLITRREPIMIPMPDVHNDALNMPVRQDPVPDFQFTGQKVIYRGIFNNCAYVKSAGRELTIPLSQKTSAPVLDDGWFSYEVVPEDADENEPAEDQDKKYSNMRLKSELLKLIILAFIVLAFTAYFLIRGMPVVLLIMYCMLIIGAAANSVFETYLTWETPTS